MGSAWNELWKESDVLCWSTRDLYLGSGKLLHEVVHEPSRGSLPRVAHDEPCCAVALYEPAGEEIECHLGAHAPQADEADAPLPLGAICCDLEKS